MPRAGDLVVNLAAGYFAVGVGAVEQGDAHGDGANVELLLLDHSDGFKNIVIHHGGCLDGVHCLEDGFCLDANLDLLFVVRHRSWLPAGR